MDTEEKEVCPDCGSEDYDGETCAECSEQSRVCPDCGSEDYDGETCNECGGSRLDCPFCGHTVDYSNGGPGPCGCSLAVFCYCTGKIIWANDDFKEYCFRKVNQCKSISNEEIGERDFGRAELSDVTSDIPWITEAILGDDGAKGHCHPNVWYFAEPSNHQEFRTMATKRGRK